MKWNGIFCALLILLNSCTKQETVGNTVETENSVSILVVDSEGKPAADVMTEIRPMWFVADTSRSSDTTDEIRNLRTDENGQVVCKGLPLGRYMVKAYSDSLGSVSELDHSEEQNDTKLTKLSLSPFGKIRGSVALPKGDRFAWVQAFGLENHVRTDSLGNFTFEKLPAGIMRIRAISKNAPTALAELDIQVRSHRTTDIGKVAPALPEEEDFGTWRHSRTLLVDSLASDWMKPLSSPTVLTLYFDSSNFDFSEAMADGRDIRILDSDGRPLVLQRTRWEADLKKAVIRVRLEPEEWMSSTAVTLLWGKTGALDIGDSGLWDGISDSLKQELYTLLVDDFEDKNIQNAFLPPIMKTYWYLVRPDSTFIVDSVLAADWNTAMQPAGAGRSGFAAHIAYRTADMSRWLIWGTDFGSRQSHSLATLDSIVYWVRGNGLYSLAFDKLTDERRKAWMHDSLTSQWVRKCIRPADLLPGDSTYGNYGWESVKDSLTNLTFFALNGSDFWIDDIRMYGVNRDNLK